MTLTEREFQEAEVINELLQGGLKLTDLSAREVGLFEAYQQEKTTEAIREATKEKHTGLKASDLPGHQIAVTDQYDWEMEMGRYNGYRGQYGMDYSSGYGGQYSGNSHGSYRGAADRDNTGLPEPGCVQVVNDKGEVVASFRIGQSDAWWWRNLSTAYPNNQHKIGDTPVIDIPEKAAKYTSTAPSFSSCTFDSTRDYMVARWGRVLHSTDKEWMGRHPHAEEMGVPQEYTPSAIQGLVEPYGMAVDRIRVKKHSFFTGEALQMWERVLGINPFAMMDHETDNMQAVEKLNAMKAEGQPDMTIEEADEMWRFEFTNNPLRPSILGERMLAAPSMSGGKRGGHARYLAPRDGNGEWFISLTLAPRETVKYHEAPVLPEYIPRKDILKLNLYQTKAPDGSDVDHKKWYNAWVAAGSPGKVEPLNPPPPPQHHQNPRSSRGSGASGAQQGKPRKAPKRGGKPGREDSHHLAFDHPFADGRQKHGVDRELPMSELQNFQDIEVLADPNLQLDELHTNFEEKGKAAFGGVSLICAICKEFKTELSMTEGLKQVCISCYIDAWEQHRCPNKRCQLGFHIEMLPLILMPDKDKDGNLEANFGCPRCEGVMTAGKAKKLLAIGALIDPEFEMEEEDDDTMLPGEIPGDLTPYIGDM